MATPQKESPPAVATARGQKEGANGKGGTSTIHPIVAKVEPTALKGNSPRPAAVNYTFEDVEEAFDATLLVQDRLLLPTLLATVLSHYTDGERVWMRLIWASSGGKTEFISALNGAPDVYPLSSLTPYTLISCWENDDGKKKKRKGEESGLLSELGNPILTFKDFSGVLSLSRGDQKRILAQFREIFDGSYTRRVGTGTEALWEGYVTMILGCTSAIDSVAGRELHQALGERFLDYRVELPSRFELTGKALEESGHENSARQLRGDVVRDFILAHACSGLGPKLPIEAGRLLTPLANFVTLARSTVARDGYTREIVTDTAYQDAEQGPRMVKQLARLAQSVLQLGTDIPPYRIVYKVAMDSIPRLRSSVLQLLGAATGPLSTPQVASALRIAEKTTERALGDLHALHLVDKYEGSHRILYWTLSEGMPQCP
jgi:hypothetical protein